MRKMLKYILINVFIATTILFISLIYFRELNNQKPNVKIEEIKKELKALPPNQSLSHPIIDELNKKNILIKNFLCNDVEVKIWENGNRFRLNGNIAYQKPNDFHMEISSIFGKEIDLGSNEKEFWYWSRRDRRPGLYWAVHEDFNKTRLKTPFDPMFMKSTLGFETLKLDDSKITENDKSIMVTYPRIDSMGRSILYSVFVNKKRKQIDGFLITNTNGQNLVECEISEYNGNLPSKINYAWHEENRTMSIYLNYPKVNQKLTNNRFSMPSYKPKINMADE